jgi:hypothetical protein
VFKLAGTFEHAPSGGDDIVLTERVMDVDGQEIQAQQHQRVFQLPKRLKPKSSSVRHEEPEIDESLNQMVQRYLDEGEHTHVTDAISHARDSAIEDDHDIEDYVYDIYYREKSDNIPLTASSNVGVM